MYHLVLFFNRVIINKVTIAWVGTTVVFPLNSSRFFKR